jgi:hypothetical protein
MTTRQLFVFNCLYFVVFASIAILTRATARRILGALVGGTAAGALALGIIAIGERQGLWHFVLAWEPYFLTVLVFDFVLSGFVFLLTWRIARRFGWQGLAALLVIAAVLGPVRDYQYMAHFPEWGTYAPGIAPILAVSATYIILGVVGHGLMRLIAGPAGADQLAKWPWNAT